MNGVQRRCEVCGELILISGRCGSRRCARARWAAFWDFTVLGSILDNSRWGWSAFATGITPAISARTNG